MDSKAPTLRLVAKAARKTRMLKNITLNTFVVPNDGNVAKQTNAPVKIIIQAKIGESGRNLKTISPMQMVIAMESAIQKLFSIDVKSPSISPIVQDARSSLQPMI